MSDEDPMAVHRLARAHPELAKELYDFFAFMIETHEASIGRRGAQSGVQSGAISLAPSPATRPKPFLALLRATGQSVRAIAASMEITPDFLVDLSDHGSVLPLKARHELARRASMVRAIDDAEAVASFDVVTTKRAASRDTAYPVSTLTFAELVNRSGLSAEQKRFWLSLG